MHSFIGYLLSCLAEFVLDVICEAVSFVLFELTKRFSIAKAIWSLCLVGMGVYVGAYGISEPSDHVVLFTFFAILVVYVFSRLLYPNVWFTEMPVGYPFLLGILVVIAERHFKQHHGWFCVTRYGLAILVSVAGMFHSWSRKTTSSCTATSPVGRHSATWEIP